jgi:hypothetical protein
VPLRDRQDGRSQRGYRCNLVEVGRYQGQGASWMTAWFDHCAYYDTRFDPTQQRPGVQVLDVADPAHPRLTASLTSPAMLAPWESLKVNQRRGLLAGVAAYNGTGPLFFDVYNVKKDCAHPILDASLPLQIAVGHEGNWAPDGRTYYAPEYHAPIINAIDVSDPAHPSLAASFRVPHLTHGLSISDDGRTAYVVADNFSGSASTSPNGLDIIDVTQVQRRQTVVQPPVIGSTYWTDGTLGQMSLPLYYGSHRFVVSVDEGSYGMARILDVNDPKHPRVVSKLKLSADLPGNAAWTARDTAGDGSFAANGHYCSVDDAHHPTALACAYIESGIRVFDIRDPFHPREIAYFNPPAQVAKHGQLPGSEHDGGAANTQPPTMSADWCSAQVRFVRVSDGSWELWTACQDNGFMTLKFTNNAYPLQPLKRHAIER